MTIDSLFLIVGLTVLGMCLCQHVIKCIRPNGWMLATGKRSFMYCCKAERNIWEETGFFASEYWLMSWGIVSIVDEIRRASTWTFKNIHIWVCRVSFYKMIIWNYEEFFIKYFSFYPRAEIKDGMVFSERTESSMFTYLLKPMTCLTECNSFCELEAIFHSSDHTIVSILVNFRSLASKSDE